MLHQVCELCITRGSQFGFDGRYESYTASPKSTAPHYLSFRYYIPRVAPFLPPSLSRHQPYKHSSTTTMNPPTPKMLLATTTAHEEPGATTNNASTNEIPANQASKLTLNTLPLDVLRCITDSLPPGAEICLALCSRSLLASLGRINLASLQLNDDDSATQRDIWENSLPYAAMIERPPKITPHANIVRRNFLRAMARERPGYFFCWACLRLHRVESLPSPWATQEEWPCASPMRLAFNWLHEYRLSFQHVQLVMERARRGGGSSSSDNDSAFGIPLEALNGIIVMPGWILRGLTLLSVDTQILSNQLHMRVQHLHEIKPGAEFIMPPYNHFVLCPHSVHARTNWRFRDLIQCKLTHSSDPQSNCPTCASHLRCSQCAMEFHFSVVEPPSALGSARYRTLICTKWINFGACISPFCPLWMRYREPSLLWAVEAPGVVAAAERARVRARYGIECPYDRDDERVIQTRYERSAALSMAALTEKNSWLVRDFRYMRFLERREWKKRSTTWVGQGSLEDLVPPPPTATTSTYGGGVVKAVMEWVEWLRGFGAAFWGEYGYLFSAEDSTTL